MIKKKIVMRVSSAFVTNVSSALYQHGRVRLLQAALTTTTCERRIAHSLVNNTLQPNGIINKDQAIELTLRLTADERKTLLSALQEYESRSIKEEYEGQLAATRWRSKFGRPVKVPKLGDVDPTGSYCPMPEDWLQKKYGMEAIDKSVEALERFTNFREGLPENVPEPTTAEKLKLGLANAIPFVGFGFLDNCIMIVMGDQIELTLGAHICLSTMAAAALGNTISDVIGIGSAYYVERAAAYVGFKPPKLTPIQLDMACSHRAANLGRVLGIIVGCLLGMLPLLFITEKTDEELTRINLKQEQIQQAM